MSIGSASLSIVVDRANMKLTLAGVVHHRNAVSLTVTGFSPSVPANLTLLVMRGTTRVCNPPTLVGSPEALGTLDTDTDVMLEVFSTVEDGSIREFDVRLWDAGNSEFIGTGVLKVLGTAKTYTGDTGTTPVVPIPGPEWNALMGNFRPIGGIMHVYDADEGGWFPLTRKGIGTQANLDIGAPSEEVVI